MPWLVSITSQGVGVHLYGVLENHSKDIDLSDPGSPSVELLFCHVVSGANTARRKEIKFYLSKSAYGTVSDLTKLIV